MSDSRDDILREQIGDLGGEQPAPDHGLGSGLGVLQHIPGQQEKLTEDEQASLDAFKAKTTAKRQVTLQVSNDVRDGWIPIDRSLLGKRSMFYPEDWEFRIRCATTEAIKNWSSIEEETLPVVNNIINEILRTCVSIYSPSKGSISWKKINSWDKFWFVLKVREFTFSSGEQMIQFEDYCTNCDNALTYTLQSDSLSYDFPDDDVIENHWNSDKMVWEIDPVKYGIQHDVIKLYCPTVGKDQAIIEWLVSQNESGKQIDETFVKFLPYMVDFLPNDSTLIDKKLRECKREFKSWDVDTFLFLDEVRRNIVINPSEQLSQRCPHCGEEVRSTVQFPNGIKHLFAVQGGHKKFGSK